MSLWIVPHAHAVHPRVRWHTVESPHFRVHYHEGRGQAELAQRVARTAEEANRVLVPLFQWAPANKTDLLLSDDVDTANGSATPFLRRVISLYAEVPDELSTLNDFDDYIWQLVSHEYTHILHLDQVYGIPRAFNATFGRLWFPNSFSPRWLTEGLAVYIESKLSSAGRLRSALFDMWLRANVVEDRPFRLDQTSHTPVRWPRGNLAYLYGAHFMRFLAETKGEGKLLDFIKTYANRGVPYALNVAADQAMGGDFPTLYQEWQRSLREAAEAQLQPVRAAGVTPATQITFSGDVTDQPHFSADGKRLYYMEGGPARRMAIRSIATEGGKTRPEVWLNVYAEFDLSPTGDRLAYSTLDRYAQYYTYEDLWEFDLITRKRYRLTKGLRATQPAYSPDGKRLVFVGRAGGGATYLALLDLQTGQVSQLLQAIPDEKLYSPTFTPDGKKIFFAQQQKGGGRFLKSFTLESSEVKSHTAGRYLVTQPQVTRDGWVLYASDRTGIYNIYALNPDTGEERQLTNVLTGAFHPALSPDGKTLAFASYTSRGYNVSTMPVTSAFLGRLGDRTPRPPPPHQDDPNTRFPDRDYSPVQSLAPLSWIPRAYSDPLGVTIGAAIRGGDLLARHVYQVEGGIGLSSREPYGSARYTARVIYPTIDLGATTSIAQVAGFAQGQYDRQTAASVNFNFPFSTIITSASVNLGYELRYYAPQFTAHYSPDQLAPSPIQRGLATTAFVSWAFSNSRTFPFSISPEQGYSFQLSFRYLGPQLGGSSNFNAAALQWRYQTYLHNPWVPHHVLALLAAGGASTGTIGARQVFGLGGSGVRDPLIQVLRGELFAAGSLRGYRPAAFGGNYFMLGTAEYRFPLLTVDRGVSALPLYLRRLHGAVFSDAGSVSNQTFSLRDIKPSVGAELRAESTIFYGTTLNARVGLARGLAKEGIWELYLTLGQPF